MLIALVAIALFFLEPWSSQWFTYDRQQMQVWQVWRLLTGNLLHTNANHLYLNLAGLALLWALHGDYYRFVTFIQTFIVASIGCTLGIYFFSPQLIVYVGLSGVLHGLFAWGACMDISNKIKSGWLLLMGLVAKLAYEQLFGASADLVQFIQANVAVDAHLYGAISGVVLGLLAMVYQSIK